MGGFCHSPGSGAPFTAFGRWPIRVVRRVVIAGTGCAFREDCKEHQYDGHVARPTLRQMSMRIPRRSLMVFFSVAALSIPVVTHADGSETDTQRLLRTHTTERYNVVVPGFSIHAGGGMTAVNAPLALVRRASPTTRTTAISCRVSRRVASSARPVPIPTSTYRWPSFTELRTSGRSPVSALPFPRWGRTHRGQARAQ